MTVLVHADTVLGQPESDTVVIDEGRVSAIGRIQDLAEIDAIRESFRGGVIVPGLRDAHIHPVGYATLANGLSVGAATRFSDIVELVRSHALGLRPGVPVIGSRLDEERLREGRLPVRHDLDRALENRPVVLTRTCGHVAVANTSALARAGVTGATADPPGGSIDRDPWGDPTGVLRESAIPLVTAALAHEIPSPSRDQMLEALNGLAALGLARLHAIVAPGTGMWCGGVGELATLLSVASDSPLLIDVYTIAHTPEELRDAADEVRGAGGRARWAGWKGFADGSLGGHTAALGRAFSDLADEQGTLRLDLVRDRALAELTLEMGGEVAIHAIGDRANRLTLELMSELVRSGADPDRLRVEHASVLSPDLVAEFARLGVTASVQPLFMSSDAGWIRHRLGDDRTPWAYPLRSLADAGVLLLGGSDSPVEDPNPWPAIAAAAEHPITPAESLSIEAAIGLYLSDPIRVGERADLGVVDRDPFVTSNLGGTRPLATYVNGERVTATPPTWTR